MALAPDSHNWGRDADNSLTVAVTTGAIANAVAVVLVSGRGTMSSFAATFDGASMTKVVEFSTATRIVQGYVLALGSISAGSKDAVVTGDGDTGWIAAGVYVLSGGHQTTPCPASGSASNSGSSVSVTVNPGVAGCAYFDATSGSSGAGPSMGAQANRSEEWNANTPGTGAGSSSWLVTASGTSQVMDWGLSGGEDLHMVALAIQPAVEAATLEQEGYRWRNDDGSESGASWKASQDVASSVAKGVPVRLRTLVNATLDPTGKAFQEEYRKVGSSQWHVLGVD